MPRTVRTNGAIPWDSEEVFYSGCLVFPSRSSFYWRCSGTTETQNAYAGRSGSYAAKALLPYSQ